MFKDTSGTWPLTIRFNLTTQKVADLIAKIKLKNKTKGYIEL